MRLAYTHSKVRDDKPDATAVVPGTDDAKFAQDPLNLARRLGARRQRRPEPRRPQRRLEPRLVFAAHGRIQPRHLRRLDDQRHRQPGRPASRTPPIASTDLNNDGNARNDRAPGFSRNSFRLPSQFSVDPRITKEIGLFSGARVQLIAEAFNLFNRSNVNGVRNTYYAVTNINNVPTKVTLQDAANPFKSATLSSGPRILQFAAKVTF